MGETVRIRANDLAMALGAVLPLVDKEPGLSIHGVLIEAAGGVLAATATDRFVIGHARVPCEGALPEPVLVWRKGAKRLAKALRHQDVAPRGHALLSIEQRGDLSKRLALGFDETSPPHEASLDDFDEWGFEWVTDVACGAKTDAGGFPDYVRLFDKWADQPRDPGPVAIAPMLLAQFEPAAKLARPNGVFPRWRFGGHRQTVRVDIGDWFAGLASPYGRLKKTELTELVTVAHPALPAEVSGG